MMKRKFVIIVLGLLLFTVGYSQEKDERDVGSFERIKVGQGIEVELVEGENEKITITTSNIDIDRVVTEVRGDILRIYLDGNRFRNIEVKITVVYKELRGIIVQSTAQIYSKSTIKADDFSIDVSSAGSADLKIEASSIDIDVASAGSVNLSGIADEIKIGVNSSGSIRAYELEVEEAYIRANSAGSIRITVTKKIDARANSAGSIRYRGNPGKEFISSNSGGSVRRAN